MTPEDPNDVVCLAKALTSPEAHLVQQKLDEAGIDSNVVGDYADVAFGETPPGESEIWVHRKDLAAAERILKQQR
jgi:hypothetical protein